MSVTLVEAAPDRGFHYPYYVHVPDRLDPDEPVPVLVEPVNVARPTDDFEEIRSRARQRAASGFGRRVADELGVPFLEAAFPRPVSDPVDWTHFVHSLDAPTMRIDGGPLERVDRQLLAMVDDGSDRLAERGIEVRDEFAMNGFSAAGVFANRFVALHPDRLVSVTAGGINLAILPVPEREATKLKHPLDVSDLVDGDALRLEYPVGVADVAELTGEPFDLEAFRTVDQFLYVGADDDSDSLLYPDAWTDPDLRMAAILTYGADVQDDRIPTCEAVYDAVDASAVFRLYDGTGHTPRPALEDVVEFHRRSFAGDDVADIRPSLGGRPPG